MRKEKTSMKLNKINLKKGDKVIFLSGRDKGKTGIIDRVSAKTSSVLVEGINIVKKHVKVSKKYPSGGVAEVVKPIKSSKVQLICTNCNKPTRVALSEAGKEKIRVCKKCGKNITVAKIESKDIKPAKVDKKVKDK